MVSSNSDYFFDLTISENDNELQDDYIVIVNWQAYTYLSSPFALFGLCLFSHG